MLIQPTLIEQFGPGIDLSSQSDGMSIRMSDPVEGFKYARNAVTRVYDLRGYEHVQQSAYHMRVHFVAGTFGS